MKVILPIEIDDAQRKVMARQLGCKGLATRKQVAMVTQSLLHAWLLNHASAQYVEDRDAWRHRQPRVKP